MADIQKLEVEGLEDLLSAIDKHKDKDVFIFCTGKVDTQTGKSWCSDCVQAHPIVERNLKHTPSGSVFITCVVGDRPTWKDPECEFRKHPKFKLKSIPTLLKWNSPQRLSDNTIMNDDLIKMMFDE